MRNRASRFLSDRNAARRLALASRWGKYVGPVILVGLVPLILSGSSQKTFILDLGGQVAVFVVVLLGLTMLYGWTGQISLGLAAFVGIGGYTTAIVDRWAGTSFQGGGVLLALEELGAVIGVCAVAGLVVGLPSVRISGLQLIIITFGSGEIFAWFLATYSSFTGGDGGLFVAPLSVGGLSTTHVIDRYFFGMAAALLFTVAVSQLRRTPVGRSMRAISHSGLAAQSVGVHVARTKLLAFVLSSVLAGIGGWLYAHDLSGVAPGYFDYFESIFLVVAILIGGLGTLLGAWLGALYLILLPQGILSLGGGGNTYTVVSGAVLVLVTIFAPSGLTDLLGRAWAFVTDRLPQRRSARPSPAPPDAGHAVPVRLGETAALSGAAGGGAALHLDGVSVSFGHVQALRDVTLELDSTRINGIIGPNGAGKTTLLNVVTGLVQPERGQVIANGRDLRGLSFRARTEFGLARTFQTPRLLESETVEINLLLGRFRLKNATFAGQAVGSPTHRRLERHDRRVVAEVADRLGLSSRDLRRRASSLPAGTRRLVEVGRVLAMEPSIILLDEPIAGLDADERHAVAEVLFEHGRSSDALITIIEHNVEWVRAVCGYLVVLDAGGVLARGEPDTVLNLPAVRRAYFGLGESLDEAASR